MSIKILFSLLITFAVTFCVINTISVSRAINNTNNISNNQVVTIATTITVESYDPESTMNLHYHEETTVNFVDGLYWWPDVPDTFDEARFTLIDFDWVGTATNCAWNATQNRIECTDGSVESYVVIYRYSYTPTIENNSLDFYHFTGSNNQQVNLTVDLIYPSNLNFVGSNLNPEIQKDNHVRWSTTFYGLFRIESTFNLNEIEVKLRGFIPCEAVDYRDIFDAFQDKMFGGDGRSFDADNGTSRFEQVVTITTDMTREPRVSPKLPWDVDTTQYSEEYGEIIAGQPYWCKRLKPNAVSEAKNQIVPDMATVSRNGKIVKTSLNIDVGNPFAFGLYPNANANIDIYIRQNEGKPTQYKINGKHDGFPAYEIYLDDKLVYCHDPLRSGNTPFSLVPGFLGKVAIPEVDWQPIEDINCQPIKGIQSSSPVGEPGSYFTITGNSFDKLSTYSHQPRPAAVNIFLNDIPLGQVNPGSEGDFQFALDTLDASLGLYTVKVEQEGTNKNYKTYFTLQRDTFIVPKLEEVELSFEVPPNIGLPLYNTFLPLLAR